MTEDLLPQKCKDVWALQRGPDATNVSAFEEVALKNNADDRRNKGSKKYKFYHQSLAFPAFLGGPELVGWLPFATSLKILGASPSSQSMKVRKAVIIVQEYSGSTFPLSGIYVDLCRFMKNVMVPEDAYEETLLLMPWFPEVTTHLDPKDWDGEAGNATGLRTLLWENPGVYARGSDSKEGVSVYQVIDRFVEILQSDVGATRFPNLDAVTIIGYSGGCKLSTRWATLSDWALDGRVRVQAAGGGCNSFLFFDAYRPARTCRPKRSTGKHWTCDAFEVPEKECDGYDNWEHGIDHVSQDYSYIRKVIHDRNLREKMIKDFMSKRILFMNGDQDDCNCNTEEGVNNADHCYHPFKPFCNDVYPDACGIFAVCGTVGGSCTKNVQGWTRLQRFTNYMAYLTDFYKREYGVDFHPKHYLHGGAHHEAGFTGNKHFRSLVYGELHTEDA